jgi:hypothetical protein
MVDPVNMQNTVARVGEVARLQNVREHTSELQGAAFSQELKRQAEKVAEEVDSSPKKERLKPREEKDSNREGKRSQLKKAKKKTGRSSSSSSSEDERGQFLDIKV